MNSRDALRIVITCRNCKQELTPGIYDGELRDVNRGETYCPAVGGKHELADWDES